MSPGGLAASGQVSELMNVKSMKSWSEVGDDALDDCGSYRRVVLRQGERSLGLPR